MLQEQRRDERHEHENQGGSETSYPGDGPHEARSPISRGLAALRPFYSFKFDFRWSQASHLDASRGNRVRPIANSYEINKLA